MHGKRFVKAFFVLNVGAAALGGPPEDGGFCKRAAGGVGPYTGISRRRRRDLSANGVPEESRAAGGVGPHVRRGGNLPPAFHGFPWEKPAVDGHR